MTTVTIELPLPHKSLSPNARVHWSTRAKHVKKARYIAGYAAMSAMNEIQMVPPMWDRAEVQCRFYFRTAHKHDTDNLTSSMKASMDGIADSGLIVNDSGFTHRPHEMFVDKKNPRVEVEITKL